MEAAAASLVTVRKPRREASGQHGNTENALLCTGQLSAFASRRLAAIVEPPPLPSTAATSQQAREQLGCSARQDEESNAMLGSFFY